MYNPPLENYIYIFTNPNQFFMFIGFSLGIIMIQILTKMIIYEIQYYNGAGEDFLQFGEDIMIKNYYTRLILNIPMEIKVYPCCLTKYWYDV